MIKAKRRRCQHDVSEYVKEDVVSFRLHGLLLSFYRLYEGNQREFCGERSSENELLKTCEATPTVKTEKGLV